MLMPKKVKHRKWHKAYSGGKSTRTVTVSFGSFGLRSLSSSWVNSRQIEAARKVMTRYVRRGGKVWIRVFPAHPVTKKGNEIPMGGGKGAVDHYVFPVKPGRVLFEIDGVSEETATKALTLAGHKLPVKTKVVKE